MSRHRDCSDALAPGTRTGCRPTCFRAAGRRVCWVLSRCRVARRPHGVVAGGGGSMSVSRVPTSLRSWMSAVSEIARAVNAAEPLERCSPGRPAGLRLVGSSSALSCSPTPRGSTCGWPLVRAQREYVALVSDGGSLLIDRRARTGHTGRAGVPRGPHRRGCRRGGGAELRSVAPARAGAGLPALLAAPLRGSSEVVG